MNCNAFNPMIRMTDRANAVGGKATSPSTVVLQLMPTIPGGTVTGQASDATELENPEYKQLVDNLYSSVLISPYPRGNITRELIAGYLHNARMVRVLRASVARMLRLMSLRSPYDSRYPQSALALMGETYNNMRNKYQEAIAWLTDAKNDIDTWYPMPKVPLLTDEEMIYGEIFRDREEEDGAILILPSISNPTGSVATITYMPNTGDDTDGSFSYSAGTAGSAYANITSIFSGLIGIAKRLFSVIKDRILASYLADGLQPVPCYDIKFNCNEQTRKVTKYHQGILWAFHNAFNPVDNFATSALNATTGVVNYASRTIGFYNNENGVILDSAKVEINSLVDKINNTYVSASACAKAEDVLRWRMGAIAGVSYTPTGIPGGIGATVTIKPTSNGFQLPLGLFDDGTDDQGNLVGVARVSFIDVISILGESTFAGNLNLIYEIVSNYSSVNYHPRLLRIALITNGTPSSSNGEGTETYYQSLQFFDLWNVEKPYDLVNHTAMRQWFGEVVKKALPIPYLVKTNQTQEYDPSHCSRSRDRKPGKGKDEAQ